MTIRLKLTLIYTLILTLVVIVFSILLYSFQSQTMLNIVARRLERDYDRISTVGLRERDDGRSNNFNPPLVQLRDFENIIIYQSDRVGDVELPLSEAGIQAVVRGEVWLERATLDGEWFLIRSQVGATAQAAAAIVQIAAPVGNETEYLNELRNMLVIGDTIVIILAFGLGWTFAGLTLRPIHRITQTAQTVGTERDFSRRVDHIGPDDEIGQLANTFNATLAQLQDAYVQVEQSLQAQRRFVADASHELRTPLTTIRGNMELLQHQPALDAAERTDILTDTIDETDRLIRLVSDLLTLARTDAKQRLPTEPLPVQPLLEDVCRQAQQLDTEHRIICESGICESGVDSTIVGNLDALRQILLILLDNAIKHTPPKSTVTVAATRNSNHVDIGVKDDGFGISAEMLPHIFERFYRGDSVRSGPGTGLGLAIAKELMEAQGGTIAVESEVGKGSVFTLSLLTARLSDSHPSNPSTL